MPSGPRRGPSRLKGVVNVRNILKTLVAGAVLAPVAAEAGSDVLIRQLAPSFDACVAVQDHMMRQLGVDPVGLDVEMDTGAVLMRRYSSNAADLVLVCNRVTDVLEVRRESHDLLPAAEGAALDAPLVDAPTAATGSL